MNIKRLIEIAEDLGLAEKANELRFYEERLTSQDKDLILPLVGEFSSGKTTLINSLLDNPNLETASRATTASIFEIRFGATECTAVIQGEDGTSVNINNVGDIKNDNLHNVEVVRVYDTSNRIGNSTVLVDTPGLSSNDPAHKIALSTYLPKADAILLLTDVNQQVTRSLTDFLNSTKLLNKPIYGVITKSDTKTPEEVEKAKVYIQKNIEIPFTKIISVSSTKGDMAQFDEIISEIQANKNKIVENSINQRVKNVAKEIAEIIGNLLKQGNSSQGLDKAIDEEQKKLDKLNRNIDLLLSDAENRIDEKAERAVSQFGKSVFTQIDSIVKSQGRESSAAINSAVNSTAIMVMQNFQKDTLSDILSLARSRQSRIEAVPMGVLETIEMADNSFNGFSSDIDISNAGHSWDKKIGVGILTAVAIGATVITAGAASAAAVGGVAAGGATATGGAAAVGGATAAGGAAAVGGATAVGGAAAAGGAAAVGGAAAAGTVIAADVATDVAATAYTTHRMKKLAKISEKAIMAKQLIDETKGNLEKTNQYNQELGQKTGMKRGIIETSVGWVTDFFAKPARQRAVNNYIDGTLIPEYRQQILTTSNSIFRNISSLLRQEALTSSENIRNNIHSLKASMTERKNEYEAKIKQYKQYITELNEI